MKRTNLSQWCRDAGPLGPALWIFDGIVGTLSDPTPIKFEPIKDQNASSFWLVAFIIAFITMVTLVAMIMLFPH